MVFSQLAHCKTAHEYYRIDLVFLSHCSEGNFDKRENFINVIYFLHRTFHERLHFASRKNCFCFFARPINFTIEKLQKRKFFDVIIVPCIEGNNRMLGHIKIIIFEQVNN